MYLWLRKVPLKVMFITACVLHPHSAVTKVPNSWKMGMLGLSPCLALLFWLLFTHLKPCNLTWWEDWPFPPLLVNAPFARKVMQISCWIFVLLNCKALYKQADGVLFADRKKKNRIGTVYIWQCLVFVGGLWPNPDGDIWFLLYARK